MFARVPKHVHNPLWMAFDVFLYGVESVRECSNPFDAFGCVLMRHQQNGRLVLRVLHHYSNNRSFVLLPLLGLGFAAFVALCVRGPHCIACFAERFERMLLPRLESLNCCTA